VKETAVKAMLWDFVTTLLLFIVCKHRYKILVSSAFNKIQKLTFKEAILAEEKKGQGTK